MSVRIVLISVLTGLLCGFWLYLAIYPFSLTRLGVYGFLFMATGMVGSNATDRVRNQEKGGRW